MKAHRGCRGKTLDIPNPILRLRNSELPTAYLVRLEIRSKLKSKSVNGTDHFGDMSVHGRVTLK
jgi:hypothetical protein